QLRRPPGAGWHDSLSQLFLPGLIAVAFQKPKQFICSSLTPHETAVETGKASLCQLYTTRDTQRRKPSLRGAKNRRRAPAMLHEFAGKALFGLALGADVHRLGLTAKSERWRRPTTHEFANGARPPPFAPLTGWPCCTFLPQLSCKIIRVPLGEWCFPFPA